MKQAINIWNRQKLKKLSFQSSHTIRLLTSQSKREKLIKLKFKLNIRIAWYFIGMLKTCKKELIKTFFKNLYNYIAKLVSELLFYFGFLRRKKRVIDICWKKLSFITYSVSCILYPWIFLPSFLLEARQ